MIHLGAGTAALLAATAFAAAAINAVAAGGTLLSFPVLLLVGLPALVANVSSTLGLLTGYAGGSIGYRDELASQAPRIRRLGAYGAAGAALGAFLLTLSSATLFRAVVPWLILVSCALLAAQTLVAHRLASRRDEAHEHRSPLLAGALLVAGVYGSFFGAGLGVLLLAVLGVFITDSLQHLNALKGFLSLLINSVAAVYFALRAPVAWEVVGVMTGPALLGGLVGARLARRLDAGALRLAMVGLGVAVAIRLLM